LGLGGGAAGDFVRERAIFAAADADMKSLRLAIKRLADIVMSALVIVLFSPVMLLIAAAIRLSSPGPVVYRQRRAGLGGVPFDIFKFRTMIHNAPDLRNPDGSTYTGEDDPRVTKIGRILRKTSMDELPQFFNVLLGSMSIVGPRPDKSDQISMYEGEEVRKLDMKPGITGYAMVKGRNDLPWKRRIELDVWYVKHHTLLLDAWIFLITIPVVALGIGVNTEAGGAKLPAESPAGGPSES
jgi:lipopolysaccharide/colanic/teichoic acid biosynthesis glycosyltransferase